MKLPEGRGNPGLEWEIGKWREVLSVLSVHSLFHRRNESLYFGARRRKDGVGVELCSHIVASSQQLRNAVVGYKVRTVRVTLQSARARTESFWRAGTPDSCYIDNKMLHRARTSRQLLRRLHTSTTTSQTSRRGLAVAAVTASALGAAVSYSVFASSASGAIHNDAAPSRTFGVEEDRNIALQPTVVSQLDDDGVLRTLGWGSNRFF